MLNKTIAVGIITAQRKITTIDRSLETFFAQRIGTIPYVFCEPKSDNFIHKHQVRIIKNDFVRGCFGNWWHAARYLLHNTNSEYILICEDDINWSRSSLSLMLSYITSDIVCTGWTPVVNHTPNVTGWHPTRNLNMYGLCGSLALLFPRKLLGDVVYHRRMTKVAQIHLDTLIGFAIQDLGIKIYSHHPSLVTHIGANNSTFDFSPIGGESTITARRCYNDCNPRRADSI